MSGRRAGRRYLVIGMLLLPVVIELLLVAWWLVTPEPEDSLDDPLLSGLLQASLDSYGAVDYFWLDTARTEHDDDPELWHLVDADSTSDYGPDGFDMRLQYAGQWRSLKDPSLTLLELDLTERYTHYYETGAPFLPDPRPAAEQRDERRMLRESQDEGSPGEMDEIVELLLACAPDEALPHYIAAGYCSERGDFTGAMAEVRAGNAARSCCVFPSRARLELQHNIDSGKHDKWLGGLARIVHDCPEPLVPLLNGLAQDASLTAIERRDAAALTDLRAMLLRIGTAPDCGGRHCRQVLWALADQYALVKAGWPEILGPNREAWEALDRRALSLDLRLTQLDPRTLPLTQLARRQLLYFCEGTLIRGDYSEYLEADWQFDCAAAERRLVNGEGRALFADAAQLAFAVDPGG